MPRKPSRASKKDERLERKLDDDLKRLIVELKKIEEESTACHYEAGRLIWANISDFSTRKDKAYGKRVLQTEYGQARVKQIAQGLGFSKSTVQNRYVLYLVVLNYNGGELLPNLYDHHYRKLYTYFVGLELKKHPRLTKQQGRRLLRNASKHAWTANKLEHEAEMLAGGSATKSPPLNDSQIAIIQRRLTTALRTVMSETNAVLNHEDRADIILDSHVQAIIGLFDRLSEVSEMSRAQAQEHLDQQGPGLQHVRPILKKLGGSYTGSKREETNWTIHELAQHIDLSSISTVADIFSGWGHMAYALKEQGFSVHANDQLMHSYLWLKWSVGNSKPMLSEADVEALLKKTPRKQPDFIETHFWRDHRGSLEKITRPNALIAQNYLANASALPTAKREMAIALLCTTVHQNTPFGAIDRHRKASKLEYDLAEEIHKRYREYVKYPFKGKQKCYVQNVDAREWLRGNKVDLLYIDPPYAGGRRLYSPYLVESIARGAFVEDIPNEFEDKKTALASLHDLFSLASRAAPYWVVAYNTSSEVDAFELGRVISQYRAQVQFQLEHKIAAASPKQRSRKRTKELLIVCVPYPRGIMDGRIATSVRGDPEAVLGDSWLLPGAFYDPDRIRVRRFMRGLTTGYQVLDDTELCHEVAEWCGAHTPMGVRDPDQFMRQEQWLLKNHREQYASVTYSDLLEVDISRLTKVWSKKAARKGKKQARSKKRK